MPLLRQGVVIMVDCKGDCHACVERSKLCLARDHYVCLVANRQVPLSAVLRPTYRNGGSERILSETITEYRKFFTPVGEHLDTNWEYEREIGVLRDKTRELLSELNEELEAIRGSKQTE
jgi:hypothetical protein